MAILGGIVGEGSLGAWLAALLGRWLIDGVAPVEDVLHALQLDELPQDGEYETLAGFLMVMLRRVPRRTDSVEFGGYKFEVLDVDSYRIDQVMVTRLAPPQLADDAPQALRDGS